MISMASGIELSEDDGHETADGRCLPRISNCVYTVAVMSGTIGHCDEFKIRG